jgi:GGDEF domain-containing protein
MTTAPVSSDSSAGAVTSSAAVVDTPADGSLPPVDVGSPAGPVPGVRRRGVGRAASGSRRRSDRQLPTPEPNPAPPAAAAEATTAAPQPAPPADNDQGQAGVATAPPAAGAGTAPRDNGSPSPVQSEPRATAPGQTASAAKADSASAVDGSPADGAASTQATAGQPAAEGSSARAKPKKRVDESAFRWTSTVEALIFVALFLGFSRIASPEDPGYLSLQPHPLWVVVLLISVRYRMREAMVGALIAAAAYTWFVVNPREGEYRFSTLALFADFHDPLLFLVVGGLISGYTQHLLERTQALRGQLAQRQQEVDALREQNRVTGQALRHLEMRIAGETTNVVDLLAELSRSKGIGVDAIKRGLLDVLRRFINAQQVTYYDVDQDTLRQRHALPGGSVPDVAVSDDFILGEAFDSRGVSHVGQFAAARDLQGYRGSLIAGCLRGANREPLGVVSVDRIAFVDYTPYTVKVFTTIVEWWGKVLEEALRLEEMRERSAYDDELGLFNYAYFASRLTQEFERTRRFSLPMSFALLRLDDADDMPPDKFAATRLAVARLLTQEFTQLEMTALYRLPDVLAISFPIAMADDARRRMDRLLAAIAAFDLRPYRDADRPLAISWAVSDYQIGMSSADEMMAQVEQDLGLPASA